MEDINDILRSRGESYGDFTSQMTAELEVMHLLACRYMSEHGTHMPVPQWLRLHRIVLKLVRLAVSPTHLDSWQDIEGYAKLVTKELDK